MTTPVAILAAGGTGGHVFPALALAEPLAASGIEPILWTDQRGREYVPEEWPHPIKIVLPRRSASGFVDRVKMCPALVFAALKGARDLPSETAVTVAFGGYPSLPGALAALLRRVPLVLHEQNAIPGLANRGLQYVASKVTTSWPTSSSETRIVSVGNPVRDAIRRARTIAWSPPSETAPFRILAIGGSQGAKRLTECVALACASLPQHLRGRILLRLQCRPADMSNIASHLQGMTAELQPFFKDMATELSAADLVICRAGSSTLAELACVGRPAILIPYPHSAHGHQDANARTFSERQAAYHLSEAKLTPTTLAKSIQSFISDREAAAKAADAARTLGRPDAAVALAGHVIAASLAHGASRSHLKPALISAQYALGQRWEEFAT